MNKDNMTNQKIADMFKEALASTAVSFRRCVNTMERLHNAGPLSPEDEEIFGRSMAAAREEETEANGQPPCSHYPTCIPSEDLHSIDCPVADWRNERRVEGKAPSQHDDPHAWTKKVVEGQPPAEVPTPERMTDDAFAYMGAAITGALHAADVRECDMERAALKLSAEVELYAETSRARKAEAEKVSPRYRQMWETASARADRFKAERDALAAKADVAGNREKALRELLAARTGKMADMAARVKELEAAVQQRDEAWWNGHGVAKDQASACIRRLRAERDCAKDDKSRLIGKNKAAVEHAKELQSVASDLRRQLAEVSP